MKLVQMKLALALPLSFLVAGVLLADSPQADARSKIKPLQNELIATLKQVAELSATRAKAANSTPLDVLQAQRQYFEAMLDAADNADERISLLQSIVDLQKKMEVLAQDGLKTGAVGQIQLLQTKAARIKAEIELEKEKASGAK